MKVYALSKGWLIFIVVSCGLLFFGSAYFLIFVNVPELIQNPSKTANWYLGAGALILAGLMLYCLLEAFKGKFVIEQDRIYLVGTISTRELLLTEIKGYRVDDKYINIEPVPADRKKIKITRYFGDSDGIIRWLNGNYRDLDILEKEEQHRQILDDVEYGMTTGERAQRLESAKMMSKILNVIGVVIAVCLIFITQLDQYTVALAVVAPFIFVLILRSYKGLIRVDQKKNSPYPTILYGLFGIILCLLIKCFREFQFLDYSGVWNLAITAAALLFVLLVVGNKEFKLKSVSGFFGLLVVAFIMFLYGFSSVLVVNCVYDRSIGHQYPASVLDKRVSRGKSTTYYLTLSPWGKQKNADEISVSGTMYNQVEVSDQVFVYLYAGKLNIPWFVVSAQ